MIRKPSRTIASLTASLAVFLFLSGGALCDGVVPAPSRDSRPFVFRPQHATPREMIEVLVPIFPLIDFRQHPATGVIAADVTPDRLEPLQRVLELLDVPRDPAELIIHLVWGSKSSFRGTVPREIRKVEPDLRARFPFARYAVEQSVFLPALERGKGKVELSPGYTLEYAVDRVEPASGEVDLRLDLSRRGIPGDRLGTVLQTSQRVYVGHPSVAGGLPLPPGHSTFEAADQRYYPNRSARSLILVIEVRLPEPPPAAAHRVAPSDEG